MNLTTAKAVVDALGGYKAVAKEFDCSPQNAHHWQQWNAFPPKYYKKFQRLLEEKGFTAPEELWGQHE